MPKTRGAMKSRMENLERNMELMQKVMEERNNCILQQMEDIRSMFSSIMAKQNSCQGESQVEPGSVEGPSTHPTNNEGKEAKEEEEIELVEEQKQWIRKKVELPYFDGSDPTGWLARAENFFEIHVVTPELKVEMAMVSMEGPAVHWFQCLKLRWPNLNWERFRGELLKRYCGRRSGNIYEQMASLKQLRSVAEYVEDYERVAAQLSSMSDDQ